jgi:hypothetical protein
VTASPDPVRQFLRHTVATAAYRANKPLHNAPESFATFHSCETTRTPAQILTHIGDLFDWALSIAQGTQTWRDSEPLPWPSEVDRFYTVVRKFDDYLASNQPLQASPETLFQGPVADALNHIGQLALLRRQSGFPIKGENYYRAEISAGRTGPDQPSPRREFD